MIYWVLLLFLDYVDLLTQTKEALLYPLFSWQNQEDQERDLRRATVAYFQPKLVQEPILKKKLTDWILQMAD